MSEQRRELSREDFRRFVDQEKKAYLEGGGTTFGRVSLPAAKICANTLRDVPLFEGRPAPISGSAHAAALEIKELIEQTKRFIAEGDADTAAQMAWAAAARFAYAEYVFQWKVDAERGQRTVNSARAGGIEKSKSNAESRTMLLAEMKRLIDDGQTINSAARIAANTNFGKSQSANRAMWYRHQKKIVTVPSTATTLTS